MYSQLLLGVNTVMWVWFMCDRMSSSLSAVDKIVVKKEDEAVEKQKEVASNNYKVAVRDLEQPPLVHDTPRALC